MARNRLSVLVMPSEVGAASVIVNGRPVGVIREQVADKPFLGLDGQRHVGKRWMPEGVTVPVDVEAPHTRNEAALLLLAITGHDHTDAARALGFKIGAPA